MGVGVSGGVAVGSRSVLGFGRRVGVRGLHGDSVGGWELEEWVSDHMCGVSRCVGRGQDEEGPGEGPGARWVDREHGFEVAQALGSGWRKRSLTVNEERMLDVWGEFWVAKGLFGMLLTERSSFALRTARAGVFDEEVE